MSIEEAMHVAADMPFWPAAYASLLTHLRIDRANPSYFSDAIQREFEQASEPILLRDWARMSRNERIYVAACIISEEVTAIADANPLAAGCNAVSHGKAAEADRSINVQSVNRNCAASEDRNHARSNRPPPSTASRRCMLAAIVGSVLTSIAAIAALLGAPHDWWVTTICAGLMIAAFLVGLVLDARS